MLGVPTATGRCAWIKLWHLASTHLQRSYYVTAIDRKFISIGILLTVLWKALVHLIHKIYDQFGGGIDEHVESVIFLP